MNIDKQANMKENTTAITTTYTKATTNTANDSKEESLGRHGGTRTKKKK